MFTFGCTVFLMVCTGLVGFLAGCLCGGVVGPLEGKTVKFPGPKGNSPKGGQNQAHH
jgi:hypothetical protein